MEASISPQPCAVGEDSNLDAEKIQSKSSYASMVSGQQTIESHLELCPISFDKDLPTVEFTVDEINAFTKEEGLQQAVILKFSYGKPNLQELRQILPKQLDVKGSCNIGQLEFRHMLVRFDLFDDFSQVLSRSNGYIRSKGDDFFFRMFSWTMDFNPRKETSKAVIWISLPDLPANLFAKKSLLSIAASVGKPIAVDKATKDRTRPSTARVKVLVNLLDKLPSKVKIKIVDPKSGKTVNLDQKIVIDNAPAFCTLCYHQGHTVNSCRRSSSKEVIASDNVSFVSSNMQKLEGDARDYLNAKQARRRNGVWVEQLKASTSAAQNAQIISKHDSNHEQHISAATGLNKEKGNSIADPSNRELTIVNGNLNPSSREEVAILCETANITPAISKSVDNVVVTDVKRVGQNIGHLDTSVDQMAKNDDSQYGHAETPGTMKSVQFSAQGDQHSSLEEQMSAVVEKEQAQGKNDNASGVKILSAEERKIESTYVGSDHNILNVDSTSSEVDDHSPLNSKVVTVASKMTSCTEQVEVISDEINPTVAKVNVSNENAHFNETLDVNLSDPPVQEGQLNGVEELQHGSIQHVASEQPRRSIDTVSAKETFPIEQGVVSLARIGPERTEAAASYDNPQLNALHTANHADFKHKKVNAQEDQLTDFSELQVNNNGHNHQNLQDINREHSLCKLINSSSGIVDIVTEGKSINVDYRHPTAQTASTKNCVNEQITKRADTVTSKKEYHCELEVVSLPMVNPKGSDFVAAAEKSQLHSDHTVSKQNGQAKNSKPKLWKDQGDFDDEETWGEGLASFSWEEEDQGSGEDSEDSIEQKIDRKIAEKNTRAKANLSATSNRRLNHNAPVYVPANNAKAFRSFEGTSMVNSNDCQLISTKISVDEKSTTQQPSTNFQRNQNPSIDINTADLSQTKQLVTVVSEISSEEKQSCTGNHLFEEGEEEDFINQCRANASIKGDLSPMHSAKSKKPHQRERSWDGNMVELRKPPMRIAKQKQAAQPNIPKSNRMKNKTSN